MKVKATILLLVLLTCSACQRDTSEPGPGYQADSRTASYPWDMGRDLAAEEAARQAEEQARQEGSEATAAAGEGEVQLPAGERWPGLSGSDTIDERILPGRWMRVVFMREEKMQLLPPEHVDRMTLRETGSFSIAPSPQADGRTYPPVDGTWSKVAPGQIELTPQGGEGITLHAELYRDDFLFFWNAVTRESYWYIRVPQSSSPQMLAKSFETSLGTFTIGSTIQNRFDFTVSGPATRSGSGFYEDGILRVRWEDEKSDTGGYGVLITSPDWSSMKGAWWIDDYESAPYGGVWDMLASAEGA